MGMGMGVGMDLGHHKAAQHRSGSTDMGLVMGMRQRPFSCASNLFHHHSHRAQPSAKAEAISQRSAVELLQELCGVPAVLITQR